MRLSLKNIVLFSFLGGCVNLLSAQTKDPVIEFIIDTEKTISPVQTTMYGVFLRI